MADHVIFVSVAEPFAASVSEERLRTIARGVLKAEDTAACELSVTVTDDETIRALNREYADKDEVTDVLSFSQREGEKFVGSSEVVPPLGDVVIAYPQALRQAKEQGRSGEKEMAWLLIHGTLHLLGFDHAEPEEERRMRSRERELLDAL